MLTLRTLAFRALAPDEGAGGAAAAPAAAPDAVDFDALADAAYDAATAPEDGKPPEAEPEEPEPEAGAPKAEDAVADAAEPVDDGVRPDEEPAAIPADVLERYPVVGQLMGLDAALSDPARAADTLRAFAQGVANHHGADLATMLGLSPAPARDDSGRFAAAAKPADAPAGTDSRPKTAQELGVSQEEYDALLAYERAGYQSPGEYRLAQQLDALRAQVAPTLEAQRASAQRAQADAQQARYESAVTAATPGAIAAVAAATGWTPTAEQVMEAARRFPEVAARSLSQAVQAANVGTILAASRTKATEAAPKPPDMPTGGPRGGPRKYEPAADGSMSWDKLADAAYEAATAA